ncbi:MAG TPA: S8 family serine peptidase [Steroidobacteraceae bacterium]|nr:S8 family serine peptidase [Steroidobacteraceae bacterium]
MTGRALAVLNPQCAAEFALRGKDLLHADLIGASTMADQTDFCSIPKDQTIYYEALGIVLIGGQLKQPETLLDSAGNTLFGKCYDDMTVPAPAPERSRRRSRSSVPLRAATATAAAVASCWADSPQLTWGVQATGAHASSRDGSGIRVAILDSGIDLEHEAFRGLPPPRLRSFVAARANFDHNGHGTHCAGTICGGWAPGGQRYGIAPRVELFVAKIFDDRLRSCDARTLAALNWAVMNQCDIVSMSVGGQVPLNSPHSPIFEAAAKAALQKNTLLIAGAGNDSSRAGSNFMPVNHPANCPSIVSVGAIDECRIVSDSSNRGLNAHGGKVDFVAPGMRVLSALAGGGIAPMDGTSMATPFVTGIAALWAQTDSSLRGQKLWDALKPHALKMRDLDPAGNAKDYGEGLPQAPP